MIGSFDSHNRRGFFVNLRSFLDIDRDNQVSISISDIDIDAIALSSNAAADRNIISRLLWQIGIKSDCDLLRPSTE